MQFQHITHSLVIVALLVSGCSSRPREFVATLKTPAADGLTFQNEFETCRTLARKGYKSNFKAAAVSTVSGTAVGLGAGTVAASAAASATQGFDAFGAAIGAGSAALFFVGIGAGFGVSRAIRSGREKKLKKAMGACLSEYGYDVDMWTKTKRRKKGWVPPVPGPANVATGVAIIPQPLPSTGLETALPASVPPSSLR